MTPPFSTLVIQPVGEPGCGKTTLSFWLIQALKHEGILAEFVPEVVKYECYTPAGQARVRSGRFDFRYLTQQARLVHPLMGQVEVLVNDGSFELFYFYGRRRVADAKLPELRRRVDESRQGLKDAWFVMPERDHRYETQGRNESEAEARIIREDMVTCLREDFAVVPRFVRHVADREVLLRDIVNEVRARASR